MVWRRWIDYEHFQEGWIVVDRCQGRLKRNSVFLHCCYLYTCVEHERTTFSTRMLKMPMHSRALLSVTGVVRDRAGCLYCAVLTGRIVFLYIPYKQLAICIVSAKLSPFIRGSELTISEQDFSYGRLNTQTTCLSNSPSCLIPSNS
jgi:hypothetical protein